MAAETEEKPKSGEGVQYRLMIPEEIHAELKECSDLTGINMRQIILDGARFRIKDLKRIFKTVSVSDYRNM